MNNAEVVKRKSGKVTILMGKMANTMTMEEVAKLLSNLLGECACDVCGNDEWLPQACKYADTECPEPKEKNGCWMQFLMQGGADMLEEEVG